MAFDRAKITVQAGNGGNGIVSFRREKFVPYGGPDGGDGGRGGSIYMVGDPGLSTLAAFTRRRHWRAGDGGNGGGRNKHGAKGDDVRITVPLGTIVRTEDGEVLADVVDIGQEVMVARAGRGGLGNSHFATSTNQVPRIAQKGEPGEVRVLNLELKLIADVGIIGFPNAGKSTLLAAASKALPKIADYPFTTLVPNLGVVVLEYDTFVLADIPGLIEGAHEGKGLGHEFLRHIERTKVLIHVLDGGEEDPRSAYDKVNAELALFEPPLHDKPQLIALNKIDQPEVRERLPEVQKALSDLLWPVYPISAASGEGVQALLRRAHAELQTMRAAEAARAPAPGEVVLRPQPVAGSLAVTREGAAWRVRGSRLERLVVMADLENEESLRLLLRHVNRSGTPLALHRAGAQAGDMVRIGELEVRWLGRQHGFALPTTLA
ncbi:MAG: GTPase ObgE [Chloroflexota bacterium]